MLVNCGAGGVTVEGDKEEEGEENKQNMSETLCGA